MTNEQPHRVNRMVSIPCSLTEWADIDAPWPLTPAEWSQLMALLEAMKPGLVVPDDTRREDQ